MEPPGGSQASRQAGWWSHTQQVGGIAQADDKGVVQLLLEGAEEKGGWQQQHVQEVEGISVHCYAGIPDGGQGVHLMQLLWSMSLLVPLLINAVPVLIQRWLHELYVLQEAEYIPCVHLRESVVAGDLAVVCDTLCESQQVLLQNLVCGLMEEQAFLVLCVQ
jgi:hypothetical protein